MKLKERWKKFETRAASWAQKVELPLFEGYSLLEVTRFFWHGIVEGAVAMRAGSIAFSFFLALFPGMIFLFNLIAFLPIQGVEDEVFSTIQRVLPPDTYDAVRGTIDDVLYNQRTGLLSFGFFFALFFATNGTSALMTSFTESIHQVGGRTFFRQYLVALGLTVVLSILFLFGIVLIIFSSSVLNSLLEFFKVGRVEPFAVESLRLLLLLGIVFMAINALYNFGVPKTRKWRMFSPGSALATFLILLSSIGFSFYVSNFAQYNKLYGSIGTLLVILLWLYINALVLIIGFELNASIASVKISKTQQELKMDMQ